MALLQIDYSRMEQLLKTATTLRDNQLADAITTPQTECTLYILSKDVLYFGIDNPLDTENFYRIHELGQERYKMRRIKFLSYLTTRGIYNLNTATADVSTLVLKLPATEEHFDLLTELAQILKSGGYLTEPIRALIPALLNNQNPQLHKPTAVAFDPFQL